MGAPIFLPMNTDATTQIIKFEKLPPLMLTYAELVQVLYPITMGYEWGEGTMRDLWKMGAPTPNSLMGTEPERRIIFPGQLAKWLADVLERKGQPITEADRAYVALQEMSR
jgi:hypothetical protein